MKDCGMYGGYKKCIHYFRWEISCEETRLEVWNWIFNWMKLATLGEVLW
jgi:hypothetical protein